MRAALGSVLDDALDGAADPFAVREALTHLVGLRPEIVDLSGPAAETLVAVAGASRSMTRLLAGDPGALAVLSDLVSPLPRRTDSPAELLAWKRREMLRIAALDLTGRAGFEATVDSISDLAAAVLAGACEIHDVGPLAIVGMGKLGGHELNYSSDVDLVFVGDGRPAELDAVARAVMRTVDPCFRVDATLRPEGRDGPLVRSIDGFETYWNRWARPWEFQALLKARPVAGDGRLGARFADTAQRWLWNRPVAADDLRELRALKARSEAAVARDRRGALDLKRGRGGIRDIEFAVQLLQLVHGQLDAGLRSPTTLVALADLSSAGYVAADDADALATAYRMLRTVEHRLQLAEEQQVHTLPTDASARRSLARVLGYRDRPEGAADDLLDHHLRRTRAQVRSIYERVWFRPLLEAFAASDEMLSPAAVETRLSAFGFTDADRTRAAVHELTRGMTRSSRLMQQFLPLVLDWLSASPDPDLGLLMLRNLLTGALSATLVEAFRESPEAARRLCTILGTSRFVGDALARNPDLVGRLPHPSRLVTHERGQLIESARAAASWRDELRDRQRTLQRWSERQITGIAARDVFGEADVETVGADLTAVAEAILEVALECIDPQVPLAVVGLGRFGGASLGYPSDLDVVVAFEGGAPADAAEATRVAQELLRFVGGAGADRIFPVDAGLRPEGRHGPLARSIDGYAAYFARWAEVWERLAFLRARPVAGDREVGRRLVEAIGPHVWSGLDEPAAREIRRMKARIERERIPADEDAEFHLKLGRGSLSDIEFTAQLLQLRHGVRGPGTLDALARLELAGVLEPRDAQVLAEAYRFCEVTRNRLFLVESAASDALPTSPAHLGWLARSLDTSPTELREHYRRVTRRARRVVERLFYSRT